MALQQAQQTEGLVLELSVIDWVAVGSIAAAITVIINVGLVDSIMIGIRSLRQGEKARNASLFVWMIEQVEEIKPYKTCVLNAPESFAEWDESVQISAVRVANRFQRIGYAVRSELIDKEHLREMFGIDVVLCWRKLEPWIRQLRAEAGEAESASKGAFLRKDFEFIAVEFEGFFLAKRPDLLNKHGV